MNQNERINHAKKLYNNQDYKEFVAFMYQASSPLDRKQNESILNHAKQLLGTSYLNSQEDGDWTHNDIHQRAAEYLYVVLVS